MTSPGSFPGLFPTVRPRRLRRTPAIRRLVAQTRLHPADLVLPMFVKESLTEPAPLSSMPGVAAAHPGLAESGCGARRCVPGVGGLMIFGIPRVRDAVGSQATDPDGILNVALADLRAEVGDDTVLMADLCLDEFTDHGHCGVLTATARWTTTPPCCGTRDGRRAGGCRRRPARHLRDDGRPGRRGPRGAGRRRPRRHRGVRLRGQVRVRVLRTVPRGGGLRARRATGAPTSRIRRTVGRRPARWPWTSPRAPTW